MSKKEASSIFQAKEKYSQRKGIKGTLHPEYLSVFFPSRLFITSSSSSILPLPDNLPLFFTLPTNHFNLSKMRFTALLVAGFAAVASCIPAQQVADNLGQLTTLSRNIQTPAKGLTILDGPLLLTGMGNFPVSRGYHVATPTEERQKG